MARYEDDDLDDEVCDEELRPRSSSPWPWLVMALGLLASAYWAQQLYQVAYGYIPGDWMGRNVNQITPEEVIVNDPSTQIFASPDYQSQVVMTARQNTRFTVGRRSGAFHELTLPNGSSGYIPITAASPGWLLLPEFQQLPWQQRSWPEKYLSVADSVWEEIPGGKSELTLLIKSNLPNAVKDVHIRIDLQDEKGITVESRDMTLNGVIPAGEIKDFEQMLVDLGGKHYPRSEIQIVAATPEG